MVTLVIRRSGESASAIIGSIQNSVHCSSEPINSFHSFICRHEIIRPSTHATHSPVCTILVLARPRRRLSVTTTRIVPYRTVPPLTRRTVPYRSVTLSTAHAKRRSEKLYPPPTPILPPLTLVTFTYRSFQSFNPLTLSNTPHTHLLIGY